jgi:hypothetical protein
LHDDPKKLLYAIDWGRSAPNNAGSIRSRHEFTRRLGGIGQAGLGHNGSAWLIHCRDAVPIPNAARATIAAEKLTTYLLNPSHKRGGAKAKFLLNLGYRTSAPEILEFDLRTQHLSLEATRTSQNAYGVAYEIEGLIKTPSGKSMRFASIWQIDTGNEVPRFITMYPR